MTVSTRFLGSGFRTRLTVVIQLLLLASFAAMAGIIYYFGERTADAHARALLRQSLLRASGRLGGIIGDSAAQNELVQRLIAAQGDALNLPALLDQVAPAFVARPTLTFVGVAVTATGEYAMLERMDDGAARLRHYAVVGEGRREIHDYEADTVGRMVRRSSQTWDGYDPRKRPFYRDAVAAGRAVWTESYIFRGNTRRAASLGATFAAPFRDAAGKLIGVVDTDFDTRALSSYLTELQRELPGRIFVMERRRDGTFRVVAHSDFEKIQALTDADLRREPAVPALENLLRQPMAERDDHLVRLALHGEDYVADFEALRGEGMPPWTVAVVMPRSAVVSEILWQQRLLWAVLGVLAVVSVFSVRFVARSMSWPLARLTHEVAQLQLDGARSTVSEAGPAEIAGLARTFNELTARIRARQEELHASTEAARRQAERLARANQALRAIAHALADEARGRVDSLRRVARICSEALAVTRAAIWQMDAAGSRMRLLAMWDAPGQRHHEDVVLETAEYPEYWEAIQRDQSVTTADAAADPRTARMHARFLAQLGRVAILDLAVVVQGRIAGVISFHLVNPEREWTTEDEILALGAADLVALELERAGREAVERAAADRAARLDRQNRALTRAAQSAALREGRIDRAFPELCEVGTDALQVVRASVWLVRPGSRTLHQMAQHEAGEGGHTQGAELALASVAKYFAALARERRIAAADAWQDPRTSELREMHLLPSGAVSLLDAGVFSRGELVGVVHFEHQGTPRPWEPEEEIFAGALADLAALALEASARRLAEEEMERSRRRLHLLIEGTPLAAIDWDRQSRIIGWNPAAERMFGIGRMAAVGRDGYWLVPERDHPKLSQVWRELLAGRANFVARFEHRRPDGATLICDWHNTLLRDPSGGAIGVTSLVEDVTERVRAEEEIRQLNASLESRVTERTAELAAANKKLQELDRLKSEFLATMSHELRTPLNSIIGFTGILKQGMAGPVNDEQRKQLELVYGSARHLLALINDLLDLSRIEAGRLQLESQEFAAIEVLRECVETLGPMVRLKQLSLRIDDHAPGLRLRSDRKRFLQIVMNLTNNAVKFTERGGVFLTLTRDDAAVVVHVTDTGPGIHEDQVEGLFHAFRQLDGSARRHYEGTGLGLYLSRKLARLLGGDVTVATFYGHGSTFTVRVALSSEPDAGRSAAPFAARS